MRVTLSSWTASTLDPRGSSLYINCRLQNHPRYSRLLEDPTTEFEFLRRGDTPPRCGFGRVKRSELAREQSRRAIGHSYLAQHASEAARVVAPFRSVVGVSRHDRPTYLFGFGILTILARRGAEQSALERFAMIVEERFQVILQFALSFHARCRALPRSPSALRPADSILRILFLGFRPWSGSSMQRCHGPFSDRKDLIVLHHAVDDAHQKHKQEQSTHVNLPSCIQIGCAERKLRAHHDNSRLVGRTEMLKSSRRCSPN